MQPENTEQTNISGTDVTADTLPVRSKGSVRPLFRYWTAFFLAITYWEIFMGRLSQDSFASINFWFLLFAVPQALVFAALCGWGRDRFDRILAAVLLLALFSFYTAQFIFFRAFDSVISLSMIGMGGDAMDDFGWAMMVTIKESWLLLVLLSLPVLLALLRVFVKKQKAIGGEDQIYLPSRGCSGGGAPVARRGAGAPSGRDERILGMESLCEFSGGRGYFGQTDRRAHDYGDGPSQFSGRGRI